MKLIEVRYEFFFNKKSIRESYKKFVEERLVEKYTDIYATFEFMHL